MLRIFCWGHTFLDETKGAYQNVGFKSLFWDADTIENRILKNILWKFLWQCDLD
jgi:hypothetical protein